MSRLANKRVSANAWYAICVTAAMRQSLKKGPVRYAVVGAGNIAQVAVLPAFTHAKKSSRLCAIISSDTTKQTALRRKYGVVVEDYDAFDALAESGELDAVYLALPNHLHREWTERAAAFGIHVLCEKPMALDEAECNAMLAATRNAGVKLMIAYRLHFEPITLRAIDLVRSGKIGKPRFFTSLFTHVVRKDNIRMRGDAGGGALYDMGVYCINAARHLFGSEPVEVFAQLVDSHHSDGKIVDDAVAATLRFADGGVAQFCCGQSTEGVATAGINGTEGSIRLSPAFEYAEANALTLTKNGKQRHFRGAKHDQFAPELNHFSQCILQDREPEPSGREGLADVRVVTALLESIARGRSVPLPSLKQPATPTLELAEGLPPVPKQHPVNAPSPSIS